MKNIELKAYYLLSRIRGAMLSRIEHEAKNKAMYCTEKPEESQLWMGYIADSSKWDYCGLLKKEEKSVLEVLEFLLDDNMDEMQHH